MTIKTCKHCGLTSPKGHQRPAKWMEKHEANCPKNPANQ